VVLHDAHVRRCLPISSLHVYGRACACVYGVSVELWLCASKLYLIKAMSPNLFFVCVRTRTRVCAYSVSVECVVVCFQIVPDKKIYFRGYMRMDPRHPPLLPSTTQTPTQPLPPNNKPYRFTQTYVLVNKLITWHYVRYISSTYDVFFRPTGWSYSRRVVLKAQLSHKRLSSKEKLS
jgi:hypothetical protein